MDALNWKKYYIKKYPPNLFRKVFWILTPIIAVGGLFYPILGLLMPFMMAFLLVLSYFKGRYWCGNICPRGGFLDYVLKPISRYQKIPQFLRSKLFGLSFLVFFFTIFILRTNKVFTLFSGWNAWLQWGYVFATLCLITSLIAIFFGLIYSPRAWCRFCPMGTLETGIYAVGNKIRDKK